MWLFYELWRCGNYVRPHVEVWPFDESFTHLDVVSSICVEVWPFDESFTHLDVVSSICVEVWPFDESFTHLDVVSSICVEVWPFCELRSLFMWSCGHFMNSTHVEV